MRTEMSSLRSDRTIRWRFALPASIFLCVVAGTLCDVRGVSPEAGEMAGLLSSFLLANTVALWVVADARSRRIDLPWDGGTFVFFTWPLFAPIYLLRTRGWRAIVPLAWFVLLSLAGGLVGSIPAFLNR